MQNKLYPKLVQDAKLMIKELEDVTVLWEELWLSTLQDLHAGMTFQVNLLVSFVWLIVYLLPKRRGGYFYLM